MESVMMEFFMESVLGICHDGVFVESVMMEFLWNLCWASVMMEFL